jgi:hypothetical protein
MRDFRLQIFVLSSLQTISKHIDQAIEASTRLTSQTCSSHAPMKFFQSILDEQVVYSTTKGFRDAPS